MKCILNNLIEKRALKISYLKAISVTPGGEIRKQDETGNKVIADITDEIRLIDEKIAKHKPMENLEKRYAVELRANSEDRIIRGTAIVFDSESINLGGFKEVVKRSAVTPELINSCNIVMLWSHGADSIPLARRNKGKGTLDIIITNKSVDFSFAALNTPQGDEILAAVRSGNVDACSFAFHVAPGGDSFEKRSDGFLRTITAFDNIADFSLVNNPAYTETSCRSFETFKQNKPMTEVRTTEIKNTTIIKPKTMEQGTFNLLRAVRNAASGKPMEAADQAIIEMGREEMRKNGLAFNGTVQVPFETRATIQATVQNQGQENVAETKAGLIAPLRAKLVCVQAGATFLSGLVGDVSIPAYSGSSAAWKGEVAPATDGAGTFSEVVLQPKRLTTFITISKQFLVQDSVNAEAMLMADLVAAIAGKLESTIFGKEAGSATQPAGFFFTAPTIAGVTSFANIVALETAVDTANAIGSAKYITNSGGRGLLKSTFKAANAPATLMEQDGTMNGYPVLVTNHVASGLQVGANEFGIIFGDFSQLVIGSWGAADLTIDPYTEAKNGNVVITVNAYFDAKVRQAVCFKTGSIK